jgi:hypothetical protein
MTETELATDLDPLAPLRSRPEVWWMGFTPDMDWDKAAAIFERKHGARPRVELRTPGALLVGPIEEGEK